ALLESRSQYERHTGRLRQSDYGEERPSEHRHRPKPSRRMAADEKGVNGAIATRQKAMGHKGLARVYHTQYRCSRNEKFAGAEKEAREAKRGLWGDADATAAKDQPPGERRRPTRTTAAPSAPSRTWGRSITPASRNARASPGRCRAATWRASRAGASPRHSPA